MFFLDSIIAFLRINAGGFVTGSVIAALQLFVVYLWADRRVERIQLKSEARKWKEARLELDATLLSLAHTLVRPLAYYTLSDTRGVYFRENYSACLRHVVDKSAMLDAMLAIYSVGLEPSSFTKITQLADQLRSAAGNANTALKNLAEIEAGFPDHLNGTGQRVEGIKRASLSIEFEIPKDKRERHEKLFVYYVLQVISEVSSISTQMSELALANHDALELNRTTRYARLAKLSRGEQTAEQDLTRINESIEELQLLAKTIESTGAVLASAAEVD